MSYSFENTIKARIKCAQDLHDSLVIGYEDLFKVKNFYKTEEAIKQRSEKYMELNVLCDRIFANGYIQFSGTEYQFEFDFRDDDFWYF